MAELKDIDYPMTNFDIKKIYPNLPVIKYPELANYQNIHHLTNNPYSGAIILVVHTPASGGEGVSGHWILVWMDKTNDDVYLFDSYGKYPDKHIIELGHDRVEYDEDNLYLTQMLENDNTIRRIIYNPNEYQNSKSMNIATCGKWCCWRLMMYLAGVLDEKQFKKLVMGAKKRMKVKGNDEVVNKIFE